MKKNIREFNFETETKDKNLSNVEKTNVKDLKSQIKDIELDIKNLKKGLEDIDIDVTDDIGRMSYVRQLTGEFLEYVKTLNDELSSQVDIPDSQELMSKMLGRSERKRYYMSKFRL